MAIDTLINTAAATVFADFVHRKKAVIPRGGIVGECVGRRIPAFRCSDTMSPYRLGRALHSCLAARRIPENVDDAAIDVEPLQERGGKGGAQHQAKAAVACGVASYLTFPVIERTGTAVSKAFVVGYLAVEVETGALADNLAAGQDIGIIMPSGRVGDRPSFTGAAFLDKFR